MQSSVSPSKNSIDVGEWGQVLEPNKNQDFPSFGKHKPGFPTIWEKFQEPLRTLSASDLN